MNKETASPSSSGYITKEGNYTGIEIETSSKKIWKNIFYISSLMAVLIPLVMYPFIEDPEYRLPLLLATIILILLSGTGFFMTRGIKSYFVIEDDKKQISYYEEFYNKVTVKAIAGFDDIKKVEIQLDEKFNYGDEGPSYYENIFSLAMVFKNGQRITISDIISEHSTSEYLITSRNMDRLTFKIDEMIKSQLCSSKCKSREQLILELKNNFQFNKDQIMELLYSPPEELRRNGEKIAGLIGCPFVPIGKTKLYGSHEAYLFVVGD